MNDAASAPPAAQPARRRNTTIKVNEIGTGDSGLEVEIDDTWSHGRDSGQVGANEGAFDKTSYLESQRHWGKSREYRPPVLFELYKPEGLYLPTDPPPLRRVIDGVDRVVIDTINNRPLRDFQVLPLTISTKVEGWLQEAWFRLDPSIEADDLIQRMPYTAHDREFATRKVINCLVRRRGRFRDVGRCLPWSLRTHRKLCQAELMQQTRDNPDTTNPNSTRHLQDLTPDEIRAFDDDTYLRGRHRNRAGKYGLTGQRRQQKDREIEQRSQARQLQAPATTSYDDSEGDEADEEQQTEAASKVILSAGEPQDMVLPYVEYHPDLPQWRLIESSPNTALTHVGHRPDLASWRGIQNYGDVGEAEAEGPWSAALEPWIGGTSQYIRAGPATEAPLAGHFYHHRDGLAIGETALPDQNLIGLEWSEATMSGSQVAQIPPAQQFDHNNLVEQDSDAWIGFDI